MNIIGKKVALRAIEKEDLKLVCELFNDPEVEDKVVGWAFPISMYQEEKWYDNNYNSSDKRFVIDTEEGTIGIATLSNIDWKNRVATHGIKILRREYRAKGYGTDTVMAVMRYAFEELQLNRLEGSWFPDNLPSKNMYMKLGWQVEGKKRKAVYKHNEYRDLEICGILKEEYEEMARKLHYWD